MSQQPPRRRSCPSTVTVVAGIAMLGTSAAFALRTSSPGIAWPRSPLTAHGSRSRHGSSSLSLSGLSAQHVASVPRVTDAAVIPSTGCAPSGRLHVQLGDNFYDLTGWRRVHPAGSHWIDRFAERDATDVMTAFHSDNALDKLKKLPVVRGKDAVEPNVVTKNFRAFRKELVEAGWFDRVWYKDAFLVASQIGTFAVGVALARTNPWLATLILGVGHTTGGWLAHDVVHGRGKFCSRMRHYGAVMCGLSSTWWSEKHNLHHAFTNVVGVDEDIMVEPAMWLWAPDDGRDRPWRRFQHLYWPVPFSLMFLIWRIDSIRAVVAKNLKLEAAFLALHYCLLGALVPLPVAIGHIMFGGWLSATIVTVTHTAEEYAEGNDSSYVETQFKTTRDAITRDPLSEYVWGGMQYQLEHHLFPTMPRYKYRELVPLVKRFAEENDIEYRATGQWNILRDNINLLKRVGAAPVSPDSPPPGAPTIVK
ncbi:unnamed protein product [Ascophyllum nodosum]